MALEVDIVRVHVSEEVRMGGESDRIDPDKWRPLIMSFTQFYGLGPRVHASRLSEIPMYHPRPKMTPLPRPVPASR